MNAYLINIDPLINSTLATRGRVVSLSYISRCVCNVVFAHCIVITISSIMVKILRNVVWTKLSSFYYSHLTTTNQFGYRYVNGCNEDICVMQQSNGKFYTTYDHLTSSSDPLESALHAPKSTKCTDLITEHHRSTTSYMSGEDTNTNKL